MRIAIVANYGLGIVKFRKQVIQALINKNHKVDVLYPVDSYKKTIEDWGASVIDIPLSRHETNIKDEYRLLRSLNSLFKNNDYDVVYTFTIKPNIYTGILARFNNFKFYPNITGLGTMFQTDGFSTEVYKRLYKYSMKKSNLVFFQNTSNYNYFVENKIINQKQSYEILPGSGVDLLEFSPMEILDREQTNFLFIGRLTTDKGILELLEAFNHKEFNNDRLHIIGINDDESIHEVVVKYQHENKNIKFLGQQDNVKEYIANCDCLVLPSYHEGLSNVLLEAGASARALIASDIPGCSEVILEGVSGYLVEPKSIQSLREKMIDFRNLDSDEKKTMGTQSYKYISSKFDRENVVREYLKLVKKR